MVGGVKGGGGMCVFAHVLKRLDKALNHSQIFIEFTHANGINSRQIGIGWAVLGVGDAWEGVVIEFVVDESVLDSFHRDRGSIVLKVIELLWLEDKGYVVWLLQLRLRWLRWRGIVGVAAAVG